MVAVTRIDLGNLKPLHDRDYVVFGIGPDAYVPMRVQRAGLGTFPYSFAKNIPNFDGQSAASTWQSLVAGATNMPTLANAPSQSTVQHQYLQFQAVSGVIDIFAVQKDNEVLQAWYGIAPSVVKVWLGQPQNQFAFTMDQQLSPLAQSGQLIDVGAITGFQSPYLSPSQETEFFALKNLSVDFTLANPIKENVNPRLMFVVNKLMVSPLRNAATALAIWQRRIPAKWVTLGDPITTAPWTGAGYGGVQPLPSEMDSLNVAEVTQLMASAGYNPITQK